MKIVFLFLALPLFAAAQKTTVNIEGFAQFKLGDSISLRQTYGCNFKEIAVDSSYNFSENSPSLNYERGENFCSNARVFVCENITIQGLKFSEGCYLTYFNGRLIDITIAQTNTDALKDLMIQKYGTTYKKIFMYGYLYNKQKLQAGGVKITPQLERQLQEEYQGSIYWSKDGNTLCVGGMNNLFAYNFGDHHYPIINEGKMGVSVTNAKEYARLIECSNSDYKIKKAAYLKKLKEKAAKF